MSVTSVQQYEAEGGIDERGRRQWTVKYKGRTDTHLDGPATVVATTLVPTHLNAYTFGSEQDTLAYRRTIKARLWNPGQSWTLWQITATYGTEPVAAPDSSSNDDPTAKPVEAWGSFLQTQVPLTKDRFGEPVLNPAGDPYLDLTRDQSRPTLFLKKTYRLADWDQDKWENAVDKLSAVTFFGKTRRRWKLNSAPWRLLQYGTSQFVEVTHEFHAAPDGKTWDFDPAARGPRYQDDEGNLVRFTDDKGREYGDGLGPLNTDGTKREATATPRVIYHDGINGLDPIEGYDELDFAAELLLPTSLGQIPPTT